MKKENCLKSKMTRNPFMIRTVILCLVFLSVIRINAQQEGVSGNNISIPESKFTLHDFAYPIDLFNKEQHSNFVFRYKIKLKFIIELKGFYDTYLLADVFKTPITTKLYVTNKLYLFSGIELESESDKLQLNLQPPQLKFKNGMGYDIEKNLFIQFDHDLHFNKSAVGAYGTPSLFSLSGKYKF
ncbi:hypothetical protein [Aureibaculum luteum]|uniref:hypothetical protein n=1 Tax=Aureibaculum luteum TaxID=1548456 RepID=UPI000E469E85|nr:hypothetical protein [Aureibaculum luteum]